MPLPPGRLLPEIRLPAIVLAGAAVDIHTDEVAQALRTSQERLAGHVGADGIALDHIALCGDLADLDASHAVARDQVARPGRRPADDVAR